MIYLHMSGSPPHLDLFDYKPELVKRTRSALGISRSLVRLECNRIWSKMLLAGIPMRELTDTRDQIVDAWTRHRL